MLKKLSAVLIAVGILCVSLALPVFAQDISNIEPDPVAPEFLEWLAKRGANLAGSENIITNPETGEQYYTGAIPSFIDTSHLSALPHIQDGSRIMEGIPESFDMRTENRLSPIRNQNPYGTCWAFATLGSLESSTLTQNLLSEVDLSEMFVAYFVYGDTRPGKSFTYSSRNLLNEGGNIDMATALLSRTGTVSESDMRYVYVTPDKLPEEYPTTQIYLKDTYKFGTMTNALRSCDWHHSMKCRIAMIYVQVSLMLQAEI